MQRPPFLDDAPERIAPRGTPHLPGQPLVQQAQAVAEQVGSLLDQINRFVRIDFEIKKHVLGEVFQPGVIGADQQPTIPTHATLAAPGPLAEDQVIPALIQASQGIGKALTIPGGRLLAAHQIGQGRRQIEVVVEAALHLAGLGVGYARPADDKGQAVAALIGRLVIPPDIQLALIFAVVRADDDGRLVINPQRL